jgi:cysteine desulfurase family protein
MNAGRRVYLDNAATSWPKPPGVYEAVDSYLRDNGASAGRGTYGSSQDVGRSIAIARRRVAALLGVAHPARIVFTFNGTDSLNLALHGILRPGDHVVTSEAEHNSVLRPLRFLQSHAGISLTHVPCDQTGRIDPDEIRAAIRSDTRLVAVVHVSNVTGVIQPVEEISRVARERDAFLLLDSAQAAGHLPIHADRWDVDLVAASGHKGLMGILGTGVLAIGPRMVERLQPLRQGGTGTESEQDVQPAHSPERFESGNHNVPGLIGLERGTAFVEQRGWEALRHHELTLTARLLDGLRTLRDVRIFGPDSPAQRTGIVSFHCARFAPQELATLLDAEYGLQLRSGLHCAPRLHERLGTMAHGGTVRASLGPFTGEQDIDALLRALEEITQG